MVGSEKSRRVLVVDDERTITDTLVMIFNSRGYEARGVYSAEEARELILSWSPDLAVIDVRLPKMNGVEFAILLKAEVPKCRLILSSGQGSTSDILEHATTEGQKFDILTKPVGPEKLLDWAAEQSDSASQELT